MAKKVVRLTEEELNAIIRQCVTEAVNETGVKTLSIVPDVAIDAADNITQRTKADSLYPRAIQSFLQPYIGKQFMFFAYRRTGNPVHLLFSVENIKKLMDGIAILSGTIIFGQEQLPGDIAIDYNKNKVLYKHKGNSQYVLEPDRRTFPHWQQIYQGLKDLSEMNTSNSQRLPALSLAIHDNIPNLELHFIETDKSHMSYEAKFQYQDVLYLDDIRMVLGGLISLRDDAYQKGNIEYNFNQQAFYRVSFSAKGNIRRIYTLEKDEDYTNMFNYFLALVSDFLTK